MDEHPHPTAPFDERAALEELDRLREQIERYKAERQSVEAEFDRFISSFKTPSEPERIAARAPAAVERPAPQPVPPPVRPAPPAPAPIHSAPVSREVAPAFPAPPPPRPEAPPIPSAAAPVPMPAAAPSVPTPSPAPPAPAPIQSAPVPREVAPAFPAPAPIRPEAPPIPIAAAPASSEEARVAHDRPETESEFAPNLSEPLPAQPEFLPAPLPVAPAAKSRGSLVLPGALILLVGGGFLTWTTLRKGAPQSSTQSRRLPVAAPPSPSPEPPPAPAAALPSPYESELTTTRTVWVRVIADGERVLERELPADTRVPIAARETLVIRTGDAGAVRLSIGGEDQGFLGREGEVTTRTFTVPDEVAR